jgi:hypothetical protein
MEYTQTYSKLKSIFSQEKSEIHIPDSDIRIHNINFRSELPLNDFMNENDRLISENNTFSYPVFSPKNAKSNKVILLLHGLNERSWIKYLAWALWLAENTSSYVILFPISFHMNRSPDSWKDPRLMGPYMKERNSEIGNTNMLSFANVALSNRLTEDPMRFFNSGYQTAVDLINLLKMIRSGRHKVIPGGCRLNVFAYSIGAFLAEILMMADPEKLFSESKLFIFCGGSVFSRMNGTSKLIMDSYAFNRVYNFYLNDFEERITGKNRISILFQSTQLGMAFRSMIDRSRLKTFRENRLRKLKDQIQCTVLRRDTVIPATGAIDTLRDTTRMDIVRVCDFPYPYSHENPFPVSASIQTDEVDKCFNMIFEEAELFFR